MSGTAVVARVGLDDRGFQEGISKIQRSLKLVQSEFAAASSKLGDFGKSTEGMRLKADSLNKQMDIQRTKVESLKKAYDESVATKGEDAKATENLKIKLNFAIQEMNSMKNELTNLNEQIRVQSSGFTKLGSKLDEIGSKMKRVGDGFSTVGDTLSKTVTAPILAAGAGLFKLASDFDEASDSIRSGTGATGEALSGLEEDFRAVYQSVDTSIGEASQVIADLNTRTGLSGESLQTLSTQMIKLAKVTDEDINTLIPAATRMFGDAGLATSDYANALDYTFRVSQSTGIGVSKLQELMTQFGGPLRQMGFDWQTAAAMLGKFEKEGVNTELVVGSLRIALGKMAKDGIAEPNKALQVMIKRIKDAGTAGQANALALEMFGAKAGPDMAAAIREGRLNLDALIQSLKSSPESIEKVYNDTADAAEQFAVLKNKLAVALEPLAKTLFQAVNNAMPAIEKLINSITKIIERFSSLSPVQQEMILKMTLVAAAIGPVLVIVGKLISIFGTLFYMIGSVSTAIGAAGGISGVLSAAFAALTGPIGIVIAAIAGLTAAFTILYKNNEAFRDKVNETWNEVKSIIIGIVEALKVLFSAFITLSLEVWEKYGADLTNIISSTFSVIASVIKVALTAIKDLIKIITSLMKGDWKGAWEGIKSLTSNLLSGIKGIIENTLGLMKNSVSLQLKVIKDLVSGVWNGIKSLTATVWDGIKSAVEKPINAAKDSVKSAIDSILGFFKNLKLPEIRIPKIKLPHFNLKGSFSLNPPSVPKLSVDWYAKGGIFNAPSIIGVGEAGAEAVLPIDRLDDILAKALAKAGGSNGGSLTLQIEHFYNNSEKDIEKLAYELQFYLTRIGRGKGGV